MPANSVVPECWEKIPEGMSNFTHTIEPGFEEKLRAGRYYGGYAGLNFYARVWFAEEQFHAEVWSYGSPRRIIVAYSLLDIMRAVSDEYGWD